MAADLVSKFAQLGLPSAFIGMFAIALFFKKNHPQVATAAAVITIFLVAVFGIWQLRESFYGRDITIDVSPPEAYAFNASGPIALDVSVRRGEALLTSSQISKPSLENIKDRLKDLGWRQPSAEKMVLESPKPEIWSTNRVYAGRSATLGQTEAGLLKISAMKFTGDGEAVVTLELADKSDPIPPQIRIRNKGLEVQSFPDKGEYYIAVRAADFTTSEPWATFSVFKTK